MLARLPVGVHDQAGHDLQVAECRTLSPRRAAEFIERPARKCTNCLTFSRNVAPAVQRGAACRRSTSARRTVDGTRPGVGHAGHGQRAKATGGGGDDPHRVQFGVRTLLGRRGCRWHVLRDHRVAAVSALFRSGGGARMVRGAGDRQRFRRVNLPAHGRSASSRGSPALTASHSIMPGSWCCWTGGCPRGRSHVIWSCAASGAHLHAWPLKR